MIVIPVFVPKFEGELVESTFFEDNAVSPVDANLEGSVDTVCASFLKFLTVATDGCLILLAVFTWPLMSEPHRNTHPAHTLFYESLDHVLRDIGQDSMCFLKNASFDFLRTSKHVQLPLQEFVDRN